MGVTSSLYGHGKRWQLQCRRHESARQKKRQHVLHKVRPLQCSQRNNTNQLLFNYPLLHQCSQKKRKRADDATNDQKEFAARVSVSIRANTGNSSSVSRR